MTQYPPQVVPGPTFYKMFSDSPLLVENPHLTVDNVGHTKCIVMVPKNYMGVLIGRSGSTIKELMRQNQVHTQTWQMGHVFVDRTTYNLPVIWTIPMPCFIIFGLQTDVLGMLTNFREIIKNTNHVRYHYSRANLYGPDTMERYHEQSKKHIKYKDDVNLGLTQTQLYKKIHQRVSEYLPEMASATKVTTFIQNHFSKKKLVTFLREVDQLVSIIADAQFLLDSGDELTHDNLQLCSEYDSHFETFTKSQETDRSDRIAYELTEDERYEGEKFIFENQLCYDN